MKTCPSCGDRKNYADDVQFCPLHGLQLEPPAEFYDAFISYRREGSGGLLSKHIKSVIESTYNKNLFRDNELGPGHFDDSLLWRIEQAPNFIVILTSGSLDRCQKEGDWLRKEIAHAIRHGKNIIPVIRGEKRRVLLPIFTSRLPRAYRRTSAPCRATTPSNTPMPMTRRLFARLWSL